MVSALPTSDTVARLVLPNTSAPRLGHLAGEALVMDEHVPLAVVATLIGCEFLLTTAVLPGRPLLGA
jgi:hypothetical protein